MTETKVKKSEHALYALCVRVYTSPQDTDGQLYLTVDGAAALMTELRKMPQPMKRETIVTYAHQGVLVAAYYLQGLVPLYRAEDVQALAESRTRIRVKHRVPKVPISPDEL